MENVIFDEEELFNEIKDRAMAEGATSAEAWNDIVEEVINEHLDIGELDKDENLEGLKENMKERFGDFKNGIEAA